MSTVTVTDLDPGVDAASADVNATMTSWNSATAAGQIAADNVRMEGIARLTFSNAGQVIATDENPALVASATASGLVRSAAYAVVPLNAAATPLQTASITIGAVSRIVLVHASVYFICASQIAAAPRLLVDLILQYSTDGGGAWTSMTGSEQSFQTRQTGNLANNGGATQIPALARCATWGYYFVAPATAIYRVAYKTTNDAGAGGVDVNFQNGSIFVEILRA